MRCKSVFSLFIALLFSTSSFALDVYYAGFSYLGEAKHISRNFPFSNTLNTTENGVSVFDEQLTSKLSGTTYSFKLNTISLADLKNEDAVSFTVALQNEVTSVEKIGDLYKLLIQLDVQLLFFDFSDMSVVASFPVNIQYNDVTDSYPSNEYISEQYKRIYFEEIDINIFDLSVERLKTVNLRKRYKNYIQVVSSSVEQEALSHSPAKENKDKLRLEQKYAQNFSQYISANQQVSILPYIKGHAIGNKLAGRYSNGEVYTLTLPEPDYAVDIEILAFKKRLFAQEKSGSSYIYASQARFKFYEPLSGKIYFDEKLFNGATKVIPRSQSSVDHWAAYNESLSILFNKFTSQLNSPSKKWLEKHSGKKGNFQSFLKLKEVIDQCR